MVSNHQEQLMDFIGSSPNRVICEMTLKGNVIRSHPSIHSFIHSFIHSSIHPFIHSSMNVEGKGGVGVDETFLRNLLGNFSYLFIFFFFGFPRKGIGFPTQAPCSPWSFTPDVNVLRVSSVFLAHTRDKRERHARKFKVRPESAWGAI